VDLDHGIPFIRAHLVEEPIAKNAGVVHHGAAADGRGRFAAESPLAFSLHARGVRLAVKPG
jgi:hypothetical protein